MLNELIVSTTKKKEFIDITSEVEKAVKESKIEEGICYVYVPHATAAITINENADPNIGTDIMHALDNLVPEGKWKHDRLDGNAAGHIKSSMIGCSTFIPIKNSRLTLGRWQNIFLCEFDGPRERTVLVKVMNG